MTILFAGGDVGGVRCLAPVAAACVAAGMDVRLVDHRAMKGEWRGDPGLLVSPDSVTDPDCLVFSSSVEDGYALRLARTMAARGVPVIHLLDHWSSYRARMLTDGGDLFQPTLYTALDERARREALAEGIAEEILLVVGQPALHDLAVRDADAPRAAPPRVLFVGEPVRRDQGEDDRHPMFRGYTELDAIDWFAGLLAAAEATILLLPHPSQPAEELLSAWRTAGRGVPAQLAPPGRRGRDHLGDVEGLAGMASMLLYEGWLYGLPVLSVQPHRRRPYLDCLAGREAAWLVDRPEQLAPAASGWLRALSEAPRAGGEAFEERRRHAEAPRAMVEAIRNCVARRRA